MSKFATARDAKEYLIGRITKEAQTRGVVLSEIERKMLYFSETGWTLPDMMEVNERFDREYKQPEYEAKITRLIRQVQASDRRDNPLDFDAWKEAVRTIRKEDHYLLVMIDESVRGG